MYTTGLRTSTSTMPPIMKFTPSTPIKEMEMEAPMYDHYRQITGYEMRTVSTRSIHRETTRKSGALPDTSQPVTLKMPLMTQNL